jgi:Ca2+-binding EF-hand superfamily protein
MHVQRLATNACSKETCRKEASLLASGANSLPEIFGQIDSNGDGKISQVDLIKALRNDDMH